MRNFYRIGETLAKWVEDENKYVLFIEDERVGYIEEDVNVFKFRIYAFVPEKPGYKYNARNLRGIKLILEEMATHLPKK